MTERAQTVYCSASEVVVSERKLPNKVRTGGLVRGDGGRVPCGANTPPPLYKEKSE